MAIEGALKAGASTVSWSTKADSTDKSRQGYAIEVGGVAESIKDDGLIGGYLGGSVVVQNSFQKSETDKVNETSLPKSTGFKGEAGLIIKPSEWLLFKPGVYVETGWTKQNLMADISNYWKGTEALKSYRGYGGSLSAETNLFGKKSDGTKRTWSIMLGLSSFLGKRTYGYILSPRDPHPGFNGIRGLGVGAGFTFGLKLHAQEQIDDDIVPPPPPPPPPIINDETQIQDGIEYVPGATKFSKDQKVELTFNSQKTEPTKAVFEFVGTDAKKEITIQPGDGQTVVLLDSIATDPVRKQLGEEWNGQVKLTSLGDTALTTPIEFPLELVKVVEAPQGEVKYSGLVGGSSGTYKAEEDVKAKLESTFTKTVSIVVDFGGKTKSISMPAGSQTVTLLAKDEQLRKDLGAWEGTPRITTVDGSKLSSAVNLGRVKLEKVEEAKEGLALSFRSGAVNRGSAASQGITADQLEKAVYDIDNYDKDALSLVRCKSLGYADVKLADGTVVKAKIAHMVISVLLGAYKKQWVIAMLPAKRNGNNTKIEWAIVPHTLKSDGTYSGPYASEVNQYPKYDYYAFDVGGWELKDGQVNYWVSADPKGIDYPGVRDLAQNKGVKTNLSLMIEAAKRK